MREIPDYIKRFRNESRRLISLSNRGHTNCIRIGDNESDEHMKLKIEACIELVKNNMEFYTECKFNNNKRSDIFVLDYSIALEIVVSESEESIQEKNKTYPESVKVIPIKRKEEAIEIIRSWV